MTVEHDFAQYIRILGKGKKGSRSLTLDEARSAMHMILADDVEPVQLGAFLMLMRIKEETPEELAGFVLAAQKSIVRPDIGTKADLDWPSYAGKRRHLPWFVLSVLLLAENGIRVLIHGSQGHSQGRIYTEAVCQYLDLPVASSLQQAVQQLQQNHLSYLPLNAFAPKLQQIIELRPLMGLRSPVHTLVRMLNPLNAPYSMQGIFHPGYLTVHQQAGLLSKQPHLAVLKGEGGEAERNPDSACRVYYVNDNKLKDTLWPAMFAKRHRKPDTLKLNELIALWRGEWVDEYAKASVIGTAAIALYFLGKAENQQQAIKLANAFWHQRDLKRLRFPR